MDDAVVTIVKILGDGFFGTTYHARVTDPKKRAEWGREVAIKVPKDEERETVLIEEFVTNAALAISLKGMDSENIVKYLGTYKVQITEQDRFFSMIMEYCPLGSLRNHLGGFETHRILPKNEAILIMQDVCKGLHSAHKCGLYHRDIKPENILLTRNKDQQLVAKLGDFGISKFLTFKEFTESCRGSIYYLPPDAIEGKSTFSSDIYSLGVVFYEMVTGVIPFTGSTPDAIMKKILEARIPEPRELNPDIEPGLSKLIMKMMCRSREERYQTADEVLSALKMYIPTSEGTVSPVQKELADCEEMIYRGNIDAAEKKLSVLMNKYPDELKVVLILSELYNRCRRFGTSIEVFQIGIQRHPEYAPFHRGLAIALSKVGDFPGARKEMCEAIQLGLEEPMKTHGEGLLKIWDMK